MKSITDWIAPYQAPHQEQASVPQDPVDQQNSLITTPPHTPDTWDAEEGDLLSDEQRKRVDRRLVQEEKYTKAIADIISVSTIEAGSMGFMPGWLLRAALPYQEPKDNPPVWHRRSYGFDLIMQPGYETRDETYVDGQGREATRTVPVCIGYPYGVYPRLYIAYAATMVVQRKERDLVFGEAFQQFMQACGRSLKGGGPRGAATIAKDQGKRTFATTFSITNNRVADNWEHKKWTLADEASLTSLLEKGSDLFQARLTLSETFYNSIREFGSAPFDLRILGQVSKSVLAMDLYLWLTHRSVSLNRDVEISWTDLMLQFGSSIKEAPKFRQNFVTALKTVEKYYLALQGNWVVESRGIVLRQRLTPSVPPKLLAR